MTIKLNRRKHMAGGSVLERVRICEDYAPEALELHVPQLSCPVCQLWPAVRELASAGEPVFSGWRGKNVLTELRGFADLRGWHGGSRLGTHSSRRSAARAIFGAGGSISQPRRSRQWHSSAHQLHLDLGREEFGAMASIMVEASEGG